MAYDDELAQRIRDLLSEEPGLTERKMFGGLAFLCRGNMFVGLNGTDLMARVGPEGYEQALASEHAREMDFTGRPMKGYVYVDPDGTAKEADLRGWLFTCLAFARTLPPKPGK